MPGNTANRTRPARPRRRWSDIEPGLGNPLAYATGQRATDAPRLVADAIAAREYALAFQPVVQAGLDSRVAFYEGLIRIFDATGRVIPAAEFMPAVESAELGRLVDCAALELGVATLQDRPELRLSINMSARSIGYPRWMQILRQGLESDVTLGERLILEISEASAMLVPELVISFMRDLQAQAVSFALDDFGSGHTSFRHLRDFYFDILKIDGNFIRGIANQPDNQVLVQALIMIGRQFDMFTVAERVEQAEDAAWLVDNGIDYLQGFHFAPPTMNPAWL